MIQRAGSPPVTLTATNSSQSVACQINNPFDLLPQGESEVEVSIDLVWTNGSESFFIDQPQGALIGKLLDQCMSILCLKIHYGNFVKHLCLNIVSLTYHYVCTCITYC